MEKITLSIFIRLLIAALMPVLLSAVFDHLDRKTKFGKWNRRLRQLLIGICFGGLAIFSTEFGIHFEGAVLNVRDAAPLSAGLIFGAPAGIIAGLIGGVERWFAVQWGAGEYTRVACSLATILAGLIGAGMRRLIFRDERLTCFQGLIAGITTEVLHMMLIFVTHMEDVYTAFTFVRRFSTIMVVANGISVMLTVYIANRPYRGAIKAGRKARRLSPIFQRGITISVMIAFLISCGFTFVLQQHIATANANELLRTGLLDIRQDINDIVDEEILHTTRTLVENMPRNYNTLRGLMGYFNVSEINIIDENGLISYSTESANVGYDMASGTQSSEFMVLLDGDVKELVQEYQTISRDSSIYRKYAGIALEQGGFVQVGYDTRRFQQAVSERLLAAARNRHIGQTGQIIISDADGNVVASRSDLRGMHLDGVAEWIDSGEVPNGAMYSMEIDGEDYHCMYMVAEGYVFFGVLPVSEALFSRDISVRVLAFLEILVYAAMFGQIYYLVKRMVVDNIHKVNKSLSRITAGDLNVTADVREIEEFEQLSDGINSTVDTLKQYIEEAESRIDKELEFARAIQHSALPSVFPPFPNRTEFDIFASMRPAREVGGDFYDFYILGSHSLGFLIADVSGKGIPAAMFMMTAKTLIKSLAETRLEVNEILTQTNNKLCETNEAGMFVTAWMGILDLQNGMLKYANAGHNPPLLCRRNGQYEYLRNRANFVLAGMEGVKYRAGEIQLNPGDRIFLYTDGVTEAINPGEELFGEDRLVDSLNGMERLPVDQVCSKVLQAVDAFAGDAPQFDDITMLALEYKLAKDGDEMRIPVEPESSELLINFVDVRNEKYEVSLKTGNRVQIAVDEIFSNILNYSGAKYMEVTYTPQGDDMYLCFKDDGVPYNPLSAAEPDVNASAEDRKIGGLGIFMVKKLTSSMKYSYKDGMNCLELLFPN